MYIIYKKNMCSLRSIVKGDLVYLLFGERATSGRVLSWNFMIVLLFMDQ